MNMDVSDTDIIEVNAHDTDIVTELSAVSTEELEVMITRLAADLNAATYRQLVMIAEFDRRRGWGDDGVRSCAHWLNWRIGVSLSAAREKLRVAHSLAKLPKTSAAFASGKLSYSKARAITRVGNIHNEECLLSYARYGTASQLDKTVNLYRRQFNNAGQPMIDYHKADLPPDPEVDQSQMSDKERFDAENQGAMHNRDYREMSSYWDEHGCLVIKARLTAEQGALVQKAIDAAVESVKAAEPSPESPSHALEAETPELNTSRLDNQQHPRRRADALVLMAEALLRDSKVHCNSDDRYQVVVQVDSNVLSKQVFEKHDGSPDCFIDHQVGLPVETARRLSCSCKIVTALTDKSEPLSIGRSSRALSTPIKRALAIRDKCCVFPGCDCHRFLQTHHIVHWANGGVTSLENLIRVCSHHHSLLHEGQYSVERLMDGQLLFRRPDGRVLTHEPIDTDDEENIHENKNPGLPMVANEPWSWCGDSMDYDLALFAMASHVRHGLQNDRQSG